MKIATGLIQCSGRFRCDRINGRKYESTFIPTLEEVIRKACNYNPPKRRRAYDIRKDLSYRARRGI